MARAWCRIPWEVGEGRTGGGESRDGEWPGEGPVVMGRQVPQG